MEGGERGLTGGIIILITNQDEEKKRKKSGICSMRGWKTAWIGSRGK